MLYKYFKNRWVLFSPLISLARTILLKHRYSAFLDIYVFYYINATALINNKRGS